MSWIIKVPFQFFTKNAVWSNPLLLLWFWSTTICFNNNENHDSFKQHSQFNLSMHIMTIIITISSIICYYPLWYLLSQNWRGAKGKSWQQPLRVTIINLFWKEWCLAYYLLLYLISLCTFTNWSIVLFQYNILEIYYFSSPIVQGRKSILYKNTSKLS